MPVTKVSSLQTRAREPLSIYRTHHYAMPCRISLHYCALLFKYFFTPKLQIHLAANQVIVLWRLDPWLIDYGGGGVLTPFLYVNDNILGVPIKVQIRLRTCVHPDYAARCTSIKKFWQLSWMILTWARLLSKLFHRPRVRSSFINEHITLLHFLAIWVQIFNADTQYELNNDKDCGVRQ